MKSKSYMITYELFGEEREMFINIGNDMEVLDNLLKNIKESIKIKNIEFREEEI